MKAMASNQAKVFPGCLRWLMSRAMAKKASRKPATVSRWGSNPLVSGCSQKESQTCRSVSIGRDRVAHLPAWQAVESPRWTQKIPLRAGAGFCKMVVETGVEPVNGKSRIDLQSTSFGHLDTPPSKERTAKVWGGFRLCQAVFCKCRIPSGRARFRSENHSKPASRKL